MLPSLPFPSPAGPTPLEFLQCPMSASFGICVEECSSDRNCSAGMLCCSNGCGRTCQMGESIPYYANLPTCPVNDFLGLCVITDESCTSDDECDTDEGELCCRRGCGRVCVEGTGSPTPCRDIRDDLDATDSGLLGAFRPDCMMDGNFSSIQCHGSSCWCVNTYTGLPLSRRTPIGTDLMCTSKW